MTLKERIGIDLGGKVRLEEGLAWAAERHFRYVDICLDDPPNELGSFEDARAKGVRELLERHGIHLGLHTLSAVNVAETSPFLRDAVDEYLRAYVDLSRRLGAEWIVVHAGYHFTSDFEQRKRAALERLRRIADHAEKAGARLLLENMNPEPKDAEVRYLGHDVAECRFFFDHLTSPALGWAYTVNHAHMLPEGIGRFTELFDLRRCGEVRLADNKGDKEEHLKPGEGTIDFRAMFDQLENAGYDRHYMMAFRSIEDMLAGRETLLQLAGRA
jgi:sugar phosphate isomerase/epimerase